jgi:hypothetical protein
LFTLGSFSESENYKKYPTSLGYFFHGVGYALFLTLNGFGYILGDFFINSSGHPAPNPTKELNRSCLPYLHCLTPNLTNLNLQIGRSI